MTDDNPSPRIPLPRTKPKEGSSHMAFKARNSTGASITVHGLITDDAVKAIMAIIVRDKEHSGPLPDNVVGINDERFAL